MFSVFVQMFEVNHFLLFSYQVSGAKIVTNAKTPGTRCYGFITMASSEEALACIEKLNHTELHGRIITVEKVCFLFL